MLFLRKEDSSNTSVVCICKAVSVSDYMCLFFLLLFSKVKNLGSWGESGPQCFPVEDLPGEVVLHQSRRYNRQETREESQIQYSFTKLPTDTVLYTGYCTAACANSPACLRACPRVCVRATKKKSRVKLGLRTMWCDL